MESVLVKLVVQIQSLVRGFLTRKRLCGTNNQYSEFLYRRKRLREHTTYDTDIGISESYPIAQRPTALQKVDPKTVYTQSKQKSDDCNGKVIVPKTGKIQLPKRNSAQFSAKCRKKLSANKGKTHITVSVSGNSSPSTKYLSSYRPYLSKYTPFLPQKKSNTQPLHTLEPSYNQKSSCVSNQLCQSKRSSLVTTPTQSNLASTRRSSLGKSTQDATVSRRSHLEPQTPRKILSERASPYKEAWPKCLLRHYYGVDIEIISKGNIPKLTVRKIKG